jgi:leader peptidase (prepilin peptidase)/N-methyltransferase
MHWLTASSVEVSHLQAAVVCLVLCASLGAFAVPLITRLPEPDPDPLPELEGAASPEAVAEREVQRQPEPGEEAERKLFARTLPPRPPKELYADIAALPHLGVWLVGWSGVIGAVFGATLGWTGALLYLVPLVPVSVVLMVIDWRTTLLPNRIIFPTYAVVVVLIPLAALVDQDLDSLYRAGWGWLVIGGWFWVFWLLTGAWGYGDVRLAGVLGPALGYLGWSHILMGLMLIVFVGGIGGLALGLIRRSLRARIPYGPAMLLGAGLAVVAGPWLAHSLLY